MTARPLSMQSVIKTSDGVFTITLVYTPKTHAEYISGKMREALVHRIMMALVKMGYKLPAINLSQDIV